MSDKPNFQHSKLVMAARKAKAETPESGVSEVRAKSAVVELDTLSKANSSEPPYEAIIHRLHTSCLLLQTKIKAIMDKMV